MRLKKSLLAFLLNPLRKGVVVKKLAKIFLIYLLVFLVSPLVWSQQNRKLDMPVAPDVELVSKKFVDKVLPKEIHKNESGQSVLSRMADDVLAYWWESTPLRNTTIVKAAESIEKKAQLNVSFEDNHKVRHMFNFKVLILQALAKLEYRGWVNAGVSYNFHSAQAEAEITKPIAQNQDLVLSQQLSSSDSISRISLNFRW